MASITSEEYLDCLWQILRSENEEHYEAGFKRLHEIDSAFENCNSLLVLERLLTDQPIQSVRFLPPILEVICTRHNIAPTIDSMVAFLRQSASSFQNQYCLSSILNWLDNCNGYLQSCQDGGHSSLGCAVVEALSWMRLPPEDSPDIKKFYQELEEVGRFLQHLCKINSRHEINQDNGEGCTMACLSQLYALISDRRQDDQLPSPALVVVLQLLTPNLLNVLIKKVKSQAPQGNEKFLQMLETLSQWMVILHPKYKHCVIELLDRFIKELQNDEKSELAAAVLPKIFGPWLNRLDESTQDESGFMIQLLVSIRSSDIYHKLIGNVAEYVTDEKSTVYDSDSKYDTIEKIENFFKFVLNFVTKEGHIPSTCGICQNYVRCLQEWKLDREKAVKTSIETMSSRKSSISCKNKGLYPSSPSETTVYASSPEKSRGELQSYFKNTSPSTSRQSNSKVGLANLGNTCYMNSVLQALGMTRQFCHEVLLYKSPNELNDQVILKKLQHLFVLLKYTHKSSLAPTELLHVSRPSYFMPGHQQDSSEFLCHLLDALFEQEKTALSPCGSISEKVDSEKMKSEEKPMEGIEEDSPLETSPMEDEPMTGIKRWTTEENLSEGSSLNRKTQSLADFTQGEDLAQTQQLSDSHSDSTDSGIQSVGGEDSASQSSLIHRVFGGEMKITYECMQCHTKSDNTDKFRDLQLCFVEDKPDLREVQELLSHYFQPEHLVGDNMYRCDKCTQLCEAKRQSTILQAPTHLILTLKHFRYDSMTRLRTKLRNKVIYNESIKLPTDNLPQTYHLYAAVVHSGYSMDYGHYFTYACDSKRNWYKFNDSYVSNTTFQDFERLEPPDTPYILFYKKSGGPETYEEDQPPLEMLSKSLQEFVEKEVASLDKDWIPAKSPHSSENNFVAGPPNKNSSGMRKNDSEDDDDASGDDNSQRSQMGPRSDSLKIL